jgi:hypothetical protein
MRALIAACSAALFFSASAAARFSARRFSSSRCSISGRSPSARFTSARAFFHVRGSDGEPVGRRTIFPLRSFQSWPCFALR